MGFTKGYVSVYVRHGEEEPASYYRITQYLNHIKSENIKTNNAVGKKQFRRCMDIKSHKLRYLYKIYIYGIINIKEIFFLLRDIIFKPETVIISRTVIPKKMGIIPYMLLKKVLRHSRLYWDFDDAIDMGEICKRQWNLLCKYSKKIIVTNNYLKNRVPVNYRQKVCILPTTDGDMQKFDLDKISKDRELEYDGIVNIIWLATAVNLPFLIRIIPALDNCAAEIYKRKKKLKLYSVCNLPLPVKTEYLEIINIKWSRKNALELLKKAHIGIMPLIDSEYARGKGAFKLIQYMSAGIPVVASDVGFSHFVVQEGTGILVDDKSNIGYWSNAIYKLAMDKTYWNDSGRKAYKKWKEDFSFEANLNIWRKLV